MADKMLDKIIRRCAIELVRAYGHKNVKATHRTTLEITIDNYLTPRGDCIIGISADKGLARFSREFKEIASSDKSIVIVLLRAGPYKDVILCRGSRNLLYSDDRRIIIRRSKYIDGATACICSNKAAADIDRRIIEYIRGPGNILEALFIALELHEIDSIYELAGSIVKNP